MVIEKITIKIYSDEKGNSPFLSWLEAIKDVKTRMRISTRIDRIQSGNLGDYKSLRKGLFELRIHCGPGYRLYFSKEKNTIILLLMGGSKRTQARDIKVAEKLLEKIRSM